MGNPRGQSCKCSRLGKAQEAIKRLLEYDLEKIVRNADIFKLYDALYDREKALETYNERRARRGSDAGL